MLRAVLIDAWPLAAALLLICGGLATLARLLRAGPPRPLAKLHADQQGGVQSLSFVLTVPVFIMLMMLAVQITQLMIGLVMVHYAAYAAARSASVWFPSRIEPGFMYGENRAGLRVLERLEDGGEVYRIQPPEPGRGKFEQIRRAAALACLPIAPSRDLGLANGDSMTSAIQNVFAAYAPDEVASNPRIAQRLANKWAYANDATTIEIRTFHRDWPPLWKLVPGPEGQYNEYEIGWQDQIRVTVIHQFALLPGPARLLARQANQSRYADTVSPQIRQRQGVYSLPLSATACLVGEGERSLIPRVYELR
jgi:hypothetical protein